MRHFAKSMGGAANEVDIAAKPLLIRDERKARAPTLTPASRRAHLNTFETVYLTDRIRDDPGCAFMGKDIVKALDVVRSQSREDRSDISVCQSTQ